MTEINKNIEGYNVDGICVGCLNYNRKMFQFEEVIECFKILGNIEVTDGHTIQVCWECLATIRNTLRFKEQIKNSINILLKYSKMHTSLNAPEDLSQFATQRLSIHKTTIHSHPNLEDENKITSDYIKIEVEEYVNEFDESGLDIKDGDHAHGDSHYQQNDLSPDRVTSCDITSSNIQCSQKHTFLVEPEDSSRCTTQQLNKDKTIIHSYPNLEDENKITSIYIKQEPGEYVNEFDQLGLDIKVEDSANEDSNYQENDHSPGSMTSDDDMQLSKLQTERNTWKRKLVDKKRKKIEIERNSKDKISKRPINLPSEPGELYTMPESKMAGTSGADVASDHFQRLEYNCQSKEIRKNKNAEYQRKYRQRQKNKNETSTEKNIRKVNLAQRQQRYRKHIKDDENIDKIFKMKESLRKKEYRHKLKCSRLNAILKQKEGKVPQISEKIYNSDNVRDKKREEITATNDVMSVNK